MAEIHDRIRTECVQILSATGLEQQLNWILVQIESATGWHEARQQCFGHIQSRSGEIELRWNETGRGLLVAQQIVTALVWGSPLSGQRDHLEARQKDAVTLLGTVRGPLELVLVDPSGLRRRDRGFLDRSRLELTKLGIGGQWRVSPMEKTAVICLSYAPLLRGELMDGVSVQTTPFRFLAP